MPVHYSTSSSVYSPVESHYTFRDELGQLPEDEEDRRMVTEPSTQTFQTFVTAHSAASDATEAPLGLPEIPGAFDTTPKLDSIAAYPNDDTPKLDSNGVFANSSGPAAAHLPQQSLHAKFKRLSMTVQLSMAGTSEDSYAFKSSFQLNVDRVNKDNNQLLHDNRTSAYYKRIDEPYGPDSSFNDSSSQIHAAETSVIRDRLSTVSSSSVSRASSPSNKDRNLDRLRLVPDTATVTSQDRTISHSSLTSFNFNDSVDPDASYMNFRGLRVLPTKQVDEQVPIRRDLVYKFDQENGSKNGLSEQEKNDFELLTRGSPDHEPETSFADSFDPRLNVSQDESLTADTTVDSIPNSTSSQIQVDEDNLASLFIRAVHPFDSSTLQSELDASICLSFDKGDLAFVHTIDESGWGEVTLVELLQRGWIPMNYFTIGVDEELPDMPESIDDDSGAIPNSAFLQPLFHACGKFLTNPLSHRNRHGKYTFSIRVVNMIRDGVRLLLQETDCLSRANEIVTKRPVVRRTRKSLLADWYNLMLKANDFKGTSSFSKVEILTLMVYQVIRKATAFLQVWLVESRHIVTRDTERALHNDMANHPLLSLPPQAKQRVTEINSLLFSYLGLILGRLDLVEHNPVGCDMLEVVTHQVILLLRELLFISKTGSDYSTEKPAELDDSLDTLLSLVSDLVTNVKALVLKTLNETDDDRNTYLAKKATKSTGPREYHYTAEGGDLLQVAAKMIKSISGTVSAIRKLFEVTGDFKLSAERSYPDYLKMKVDPEEFVRKCTLGVVQYQDLTAAQLKAYMPAKKQAMNRFLMMRTGQTGALDITPGGLTMLHSAMGDKFGDDEAFQPFTTNNSKIKENINDELLVDSNGNLLGASFKGLVYTLTNEDSPPEYFFVSTFFICFRTFTNGIDLIEELITRFELGDSQVDINHEMKLKNRRRLIVKMFQLWLESYWSNDADAPLLTTFINFFNEGVATYLPLDAIKLLEVAAKLSAKPLVENQAKGRKHKPAKQLITRSITVTRLNRKNANERTFVDGSLGSRYSMVDGFELSKINTNSSAASSLKSMTLPLPLGIGNQTSSANSLLTKNQLITIEKVNLTYRAILGASWCNENLISTKEFVPLPLPLMLDNWYRICDQSWVLSNYRPNLLDFNGLEIAKQLTLVELHIFCSIKPEELLNENYTTKRAHLQLAPNVRKSVLFTNSLSSYVLESILQPKINMKMRVNMVKTWLKVAISCLYLRNFNSLAAIITSLQLHLVTRLDRLWVELSEKYTELYEYLSGIVHPDKNYSVYRTKLRNFLVANDYNIPIVPYFQLFLQDLTFVMDGNPNFRKANTFLNQKLINIDKYLKITRIIADIESLQIPYGLQSVVKETNRNSIFGGSKPQELEDYNIVASPHLQELLLLEVWKVCQLNRKEDDRAWKLSCLIQPREGQ